MTINYGCEDASDECAGPLLDGPCPYSYEIHDDDSPHTLCDYHFHERALEV